MKYFVIFWSLSLIFISQSLRIKNFEHYQELNSGITISATNSATNIIHYDTSNTTKVVVNSLNVLYPSKKKQTQTLVKEKQVSASQKAIPTYQNIQTEKKSQSTEPKKNQQPKNQPLKKLFETQILQIQKPKALQSGSTELKKETSVEKQSTTKQKPAPLPVPGFDAQQKPKQDTKKAKNIEQGKEAKKNKSQNDQPTKNETKKEQSIKNLERKDQPQKQKQEQKNSGSSQQWTKKDEQEFKEWKKNLIPVSDPKLKDDYEKLIQKQKQRRIKEKKTKSKGK